MTAAEQQMARESRNSGQRRHSGWPWTQLNSGGIFPAAAAEGTSPDCFQTVTLNGRRWLLQQQQQPVWSPSWAAAAVAWTGCTTAAVEAAPRTSVLYFSRRNRMDVGCSGGISPAAAAEAADMMCFWMLLNAIEG
ncbi:hypothetical protein PHYPSEUDO_009578 [Phytophthora pseudosyringae]|uniref:Uncharacterized protein n=1 Tax=Phytophthora pseudosyringae TaxID=221518 RepID=A0A8T1WLR0_9STRA|nr:hypothetical protein PHYPSEUDO_009578 [Phytophthora pseudosyringae]